MVIGLGRLLIFSSFVLVFLSFLLLSTIFNVLKKPEDPTETYTYQYLEKNYLRDETTFGVVSIFEKIEDSNDFISYFDKENQKQVLISPFGSEEYECYGSCFCTAEENELHDRRRVFGMKNQKVLKEGVSLLIAAVSSLGVLYVAEEYFGKKCEEIFSPKDLCDPSSIRFEVNNCENVIDSKDDEHETQVERIFYCYGNCLDRINTHHPSTEHNDIDGDYISKSGKRPTAAEKGLDCRKLKQEGEVYISEKQPSLQIIANLAKIRFQQDYLVDFCRGKSVVEYIYRNPKKLSSDPEKTIYFEVKKMGSMCTAVKLKNNMKNVNCRQIHPKPKAHNTEWQDKVWWEKKHEWDRS